MKDIRTQAHPAKFSPTDTASKLRHLSNIYIFRNDSVRDRNVASCITRPEFRVPRVPSVYPRVDIAAANDTFISCARFAVVVVVVVVVVVRALKRIQYPWGRLIFTHEGCKKGEEQLARRARCRSAGRIKDMKIVKTLKRALIIKGRSSATS